MSNTWRDSRSRPATVCVVLGLLLVLSPAAPARPDNPVELQGLCFRSPVALSNPKPVGLDAVMVAHPPGADAQSERFSLTAVHFPLVVTDTKAGMTTAELRDYVATVFLAGQAKEGTPIQRRLLENLVDGLAFSTPIPAPSLAEVYALRLQNRETVVLGFKFRSDWRSEAESLITAIAASLQECSTDQP
ncbi:hypothetical protein KBZ18_16335 [Synechococcus sp. Cruz-9H2]|uniref:hypothetical protein n=1 Tax=unclassified Synechococcus TaxID=2626047 RepID=UPI0020CE10C9|nr:MULTISPECIES: hypothetical protein [unclassified Synechococcus]MCP9821040.1 hypothetical protein [Synechococcus sp. Cruz-9H2]MCP9845276.1 hypothetical protein [Synechococcus sp. Edmonson 11F2]MCP9857441.1 hypothetical protein [Synechococcus sp. Cruz-9C9]MCP9864684.1 hypothetical protein [Synechococcus sp. Cruz-7E5]MCP9871953.1 hypothetical protein [Synechococcus sp. Cruz-7B9]